MSESKKAELRTATAAADEGLFVFAVGHGAVVLEKVVAAAAQVAREASRGVHEQVTGALDWIEEAERLVVRVARSAVEADGAVVGEVVDRSEALTLAVIGVVRDTAREAGAVLTRAVGSMAGEVREERRAA